MAFVRLAATLFFPAVLVAHRSEPNTPDAGARTAAAKAVALIQNVGAHWKHACASRRNHLLPLLAFQRAREHGVPVDEERATKMLRHSLLSFRSDYAIQGWNPEATYENAFTLIAAHDSGVPANDTASSYAGLFARRQMPDGRWLLDDDRPPTFYVSAAYLAAGAGEAETLQFLLDKRANPHRNSKIQRELERAGAVK